MRTSAIGTALALMVAVTASFAGEKKVTITGEAKCAKCVMKQSKECQNVIQAETDGKMVTYYLADNSVSREFQGKLCRKLKKIEATGTVKESDGKMWLTAGKIEPADK